MSLKNAIRGRLRRLRRELRTLGGRDLRLRLDVRLPALHLGTEYGGWLISPRHTPRNCTVFSVGVGTDISFDLEMIRRYGATVHAFDPTPKAVAWVASQQVPAQFRFHAMGLAHFDGEQVFRLARDDYISYSTDMPAGVRSVDEVWCPVRRLSTLAADLNCPSIDILKMDIEGGEYTAIPDVLASGVPIRQLLLELHFDQTRTRLERAADLVEQARSAGFSLFARSAVGKELSFVYLPQG